MKSEPLEVIRGSGQSTGRTWTEPYKKFNYEVRMEAMRADGDDFFAGKQTECRYDHFTMGGGKIDAMMHCGKEEHSQTMRMAGTYSSDAYQMQMATEAQTGDEGIGAMQMQMRVESRRIGECGAKQS